MRYEIVLYALLHDIGKPIMRFAKRYLEGLERDPKAEYIKQYLTELFRTEFEAGLKDIARSKHDVLSEQFIKKLCPTCITSDSREMLKCILSHVDPIAAAERGYEVCYRNCYEKLEEVNILEKISSEISARFGRAVHYSYHTSPLLSPLWILCATKYLDYAGPKAYSKHIAGAWDSHRAWTELRNHLEPLLEALEKCDAENIVKKNAELLHDLMNLPLWIPVKSLKLENLLELKALTYEEAAKESSYGDVLEVLLKPLDTLRKVYGASASRDFIDTLLALMKSSMMFVPSAVYASITPDIGLYSHSKLVAAYAAARVEGRPIYRILAIDVNGIQEFVSAPVKAAAASRVMRGRSLLIELALDSLAHYVLEVFNELPLTNVIVSEGGTLEIIVPNVEDLERRVEKIREVSRKLSGIELCRSLEFTVAISKPFDEGMASYIDALRTGKGFIEVEESLARDLAVEKSRRGMKTTCLVSETHIEDFDVLTNEPVLDKDPHKLRVENEEIKKYADMIAGPDKLTMGDSISTATHLSLVAGSCARNLVAIITIHCYKRVNDVLEPDTDAISMILDDARKKLLQSDRAWMLMTTRQIEGLEYRWDIGLIPLTSSGSLYILGAMHRPKPYDPRKLEDLKDAWSYLYFILKELQSTLENLAKREPKPKIVMEIKLVNAPHAFIPTPEIAGEIFDNICKIIETLRNVGIEVSFDYVFMSTHHPTKLVDDRLALVDLDEFQIIAVTKMDADMMGEVKNTLAFSPSRLVTLSDITNLAIASKTYLKVLELLDDVEKSQRLKRIDVIPLYAGGDDLVIYGRWDHVVWYSSIVYDEIRSVLRPLLFSGAIAIDRDHVPILDLYRHAVEMLEDYAKQIKASVVVAYPAPRVVKLDSGEVMVHVMPFEHPSQFYPWNADRANVWNLKSLARILDPLQDKIDKLSNFKRDLYILAFLGNEIQRMYELRRTTVGSTKILAMLVKLEIAYAYIWTRRSEELRELKKHLEDVVDEGILIYPDETRIHGVREALRCLLAAKPVLDMIILAIRYKETLE